MEKTLLIPSSLYESVQQVEKLVNDVYEEYTFSPHIYGNMLVALSEAVTNAVLHGNKSDTQKQIQIRCVTNEKHVTFEVKDEGNGFDYTQITDPTMLENLSKIGGRGVMIMTALSDDVLYEKNGTVVKLKFNLNN
ncbi:MAG TPA: ATP-binding protein [Chitinophagales bacterium]